MSTSSPFDEPSDESGRVAEIDVAAERGRIYARTRKRALFGGMIALVALAWMKEFARLSDTFVWLFAGGVLCLIVVVYTTANEEARERRIQSHRRLIRRRQRDRRLREKYAALAELHEQLPGGHPRCPDCDADTATIVLMTGDGASLLYGDTNADSTRSGPSRAKGEVYAELCPACDRVCLRAFPYEGQP